MDSKYLEGRARVPLSNIRSEDLQVDTVTFGANSFGQLGNPQTILSVRITSETRDDILRDLSCTPEQLYATIESSQPPPLLTTHSVFYPATEEELESAKATHGRDFICNVKLYCIPVQPRTISDGTVFQNVRYYMASSWKENRVSVAQAWMDKLSSPKRKNLASLLRHADVVAVMDDLLCLPGYWEGLQLGNWAKHLAARINQLIINYWKHIKEVALRIMAGHEDLLHLFDAKTVSCLQHRAPSWFSEDRKAICELFADKTLFPKIQSESVRDRIRENVLQLRGLIPSIQSFHENMKYITIGAKILEKHVEMRPKESRTGQIAPSATSLIDNLKKEWTSQGAAMETGHDQMRSLTWPNVDNAILQAFIAALRYFPFLSPEAPLRDSDRKVWMAASFDGGVLTRLYITLKAIGFCNKNIEEGRQKPIENKQILYVQPQIKRDWRGGKPCLASYHTLLESSFFPELFSRTNDSEPSHAILVQSDILQAFFGGTPDVPSFAPTVVPPPDIEMTADSEVRVDEVLRSWEKVDPQTTPKRKARKKPRGLLQVVRQQKKATHARRVPRIPATRTSGLDIGLPEVSSNGPTKRKRDEEQPVDSRAQIRNAHRSGERAERPAKVQCDRSRPTAVEEAAATSSTQSARAPTPPPTRTPQKQTTVTQKTPGTSTERRRPPTPPPSRGQALASAERGLAHPSWKRKNPVVDPAPSLAPQASTETRNLHTAESSQQPNQNVSAPEDFSVPDVNEEEERLSPPSFG